MTDSLLTGKICNHDTLKPAMKVTEKLESNEHESENVTTVKCKYISKQKNTLKHSQPPVFNVMKRTCGYGSFLPIVCHKYFTQKYHMVHINIHN